MTIARRLTDKLVPDVWFEAKVVWEVKAADLSISPVYTAGVGKVDANKGISIRFPRLVRFPHPPRPHSALRFTRACQQPATQHTFCHCVANLAK